MTPENVLLINSYGGSILAAAMNKKVPILASMESGGYGLEIQRFNAPNLKFFDKTADWPKGKDLSRTLVIGHPPCSAFSTMNTSMRKKVAAGRDAPPPEDGEDGSGDAPARGPASVDSAAFQCTKDLLNYAMNPEGDGKQAEMVMIESVPRALEEGKTVHDYFANRYGYSIFRIVQNASNFGVCQNRKRFWCVFAKDRGREFVVRRPNVKPPNVQDVVQQVGPPCEDHVKVLNFYKQRMMAEKSHVGIAGQKNYQADVPNPRVMTEKEVNDVFSGVYGFGKLYEILTEIKDFEFAKFVHNNRWTSSSPNMLRPGKLPNVVLGCSMWLMNGELLRLRDYFNIMGYPDFYRYPERVAKNGAKALGYLSRGVCPPIVEWLLENFMINVVPTDVALVEDDNDELLVRIKDGETVDFTRPIKERKMENGEKAPRTIRVRVNKDEKVDDGFNPLAPALVPTAEAW